VKNRTDYSGFSGGMCSVASGEKCLPNQLQEARNVIISDNGIIRKRHGITQNLPQIYPDFVLDVAAAGIVSAHDKKLYLAGVAAHTYTTGGLGQFMTSDGGTIHSNGSDAMVVCSVNPAQAVLGAPLSRILFKHNDRAFVALNNVVYETAPGTYPSYTVDNFAGGASWTIGDTTQNVTGLGSIGRNLLIFKEKSIYVQVGYTKNERQTYILTDRYGCLSPDTIKNIELIGLGSAVMFLSESGRLCAATMSGVIEIGDAVQDYLDSIYFSTPVNEKALASFMHRARAAVLPDGFYILSFATAATDTYAAWGQALCVNLKQPYQSQFNGMRWPITLWKNTGATDSLNTSFLAMSSEQKGATGKAVVLIGINTALGYAVGNISPLYFQDWELDAGALPVYKFIHFKIKTKNDEAGDAQHEKIWHDVIIKATNMSTSSIGLAVFNFLITQEIDYNLTMYDADPVTNVAFKPVVYQESPGSWAAGESPPYYPLGVRRTMVYEIRHNIVGGGRKTAIVLESFAVAPMTTFTSNNDDLQIHSMSLLFDVGNTG
jgi:hypothetical protein